MPLLRTALLTLATLVVTGCVDPSRPTVSDPAPVAFRLELPPDVDPAGIHWEIPGATVIEVDRSGDLLLETTGGRTHHARPLLIEPFAR